MSATNDNHDDRPVVPAGAVRLRSASEQLFFLDMPVAHGVAYEDHARQRRLSKSGGSGRGERRALQFFD
jgi:hypothetical protein